MKKREELMVSLEDATKTLTQYTNKLAAGYRSVESLPLWDAGGRIIAEDVTAKENLPPFDRSLVDGFALKAGDTAAADKQSVRLKVIDTVAAGTPSQKELMPQTAMKIFTGAPLPQGTDSVVKIEEVTETSAPHTITVSRSIRTGECVSYQGEDIAGGEFLIARGTVLLPAHLAVLATLGYEHVNVFTKPQIGIFSTGNELSAVSENPRPGQLRASNLYALAEIIRQAGGIPVSLGLVKDRTTDVSQTYHAAREQKLPLVISTGGTASGDYDVIKAAMDEFAAARLFNKVAIRPGAPVVASTVNGQLLLGLSGNPSGAAVAMLLLVYPLISQLAGCRRKLTTAQATLTKRLTRRGGLRSFLWANYHVADGQIKVTPQENQFCGTIKTYLNSNCFIELPAKPVELPPKRMVTIWKLPQ